MTLFFETYDFIFRTANLCCFITNSTAKIQLKILGRTFRLTSGAIVNAKKLTLCWVLSHNAKKRLHGFFNKIANQLPTVPFAKIYAVFRN